MTRVELRPRPSGAWAAAGWGEGTTWEEALEVALSQLVTPRWPGGGSEVQEPRGPAAASSRERPLAPDLLCVFASSVFVYDFAPLVECARDATRARHLLGCSGWGVIGGARELEGRPAVSLLALSLPSATFQPVRLTQEHVDAAPPAGDGAAATAAYWRRVTATAPDEVNAWLLFADPFRSSADSLVDGLGATYPDAPIIGGLASAGPGAQRTHVFFDGDVYGDGSVAVALGGAWTVEAIVSQGCAPIGRPWTITGVDGHLVQTIARQPAYELLVDTVKALPPALAARARDNLFVGLAMDERRATLNRGDFLVRNIHGVDQQTGALLVGAEPQIGQTVQFHLRDAGAAGEDLRQLLDTVPERLAGRSPAAALLCSCTGRGTGLFGAPDHDARLVNDRLGPLPLAGFFCNGEFGPVGGRNYVHGYTASLALFVPKQGENGERRMKNEEL
ncbi:MAG: FIST C-terminal domain-containing protein [Chloroflexi bacterium]|nr:FIST C-terminal domain-containing protein [Chloroflexota bacterium]